MIKVGIQHACGHEATHGLSGSEAQRKQREEWLRRQPCQVCWRAIQSATANAQAEEWNLVPLEGSDEEKAWADVVRMKAMGHNMDFHGRVTESRKFGANEEAMKRAVVTAADEAMAYLKNQRSAAWWIENRFDVLTFVKRQVIAAVTPILNDRADERG